MEFDQLLNLLRDDIVRVCQPVKVYLFSQKQKPCGDFCAVKLCVIIPDGNSRMTERRLYVEVESELSFDVLVYTVEEWKKLLDNQMSFATQIVKTGREIYAADETR